MTLTIDEIKKIAALAKLKFTDEELKRFEMEFNNILNYVSSIRECDTAGIDFEHNLSDYQDNVLQEDIPTPSIPREEILQNATEGRSKLGYVKTSKIVTKE